MKNKRLLVGFVTFSIIVFLCILPSFKSFAGTCGGGQLYVSGPAPSTEIPTVTIMCTYNSENSIYNHFLTFNWSDPYNCTLEKHITFNGQIDPATSGTVDYNINYLGNIYTGTFTLSTHDIGSAGNPLYKTLDGSTPLITGYAPSAGSPSGKSPSELFNESIKRECDEIRYVAATGLNTNGTVAVNKVIHYDTGNALSGEIIKTMASVQGVTLEYTFEYKGIIFKSIITPEKAAAVAGENVPWCGPCYLANNFPTVPVGVVPAV